MLGRIIIFLKSLWAEYRFIVFFFVFVVVPVRSSLADWNWVPTGSMKPNIVEGDLVFVNKAAYDIRFPLTLQRLHQYADPEPGDVVVCFSPEESGTRLIKRVIAVPGDVIELRQSRLWINDKVALYGEAEAEVHKDVGEWLQSHGEFLVEQIAGSDRTIVQSPNLYTSGRNFGPYRVPEGTFFVMGDNRDNSHDSRAFGAVCRKQIIGKGQRILFSFDRDDRQVRWGRCGKELE